MGRGFRGFLQRIGSTLGAGIYVVVGEVARLSAGPAVILSFLIAALSSILSGLCYAEFGARVPKTGSAYIYSYVSVGELMAFLTGWNLILQYIIATSSVARAWSSNFDGLIDGRMSQFFSNHLAMNSTGLADYVDPFAFGITMVVTAVLSFGAQESSIINNVFTVVNLGVISYVVITGLFRVDIANWRVDPAKIPDSDPNKANAGAGGFLPFGFSGVISGAGTCFYSFVGFDIIAATGEEVRNPQKAIPIAILVCLLVCFGAYAAVSAVLTLMVPYYSLPNMAPLQFAFEHVGWNVAKYIIAVGAICALSTSLLGSMFPLPRILYAMASDGLVFPFLGRINQRFRTPMLSTILSGILAGIMASLFSLKDLVDMMSIGTLFAYSLVAVSVLIMRGQRRSVGLVNNETNDKTRLDEEHNIITSRDLNLEPGIVIPVPHDGDEKNARERSVSVCSEDFDTPTSPATFGEYMRLCFLGSDGDSGPTAVTEWINLTNTYLLLLTFIFLNIGLIYFDSDTLQDDLTYFVIACILIGVMSILAILLCVSLARLPQNKTKVSFKVPGVPWVPALSVLINLHLMFRMSGTTWTFYAVGTFIGLGIYFAYGYWFSAVRKASRQTENADTDVEMPEVAARMDE